MGLKLVRRSTKQHHHLGSISYGSTYQITLWGRGKQHGSPGNHYIPQVPATISRRSSPGRGQDDRLSRETTTIPGKIRDRAPGRPCRTFLSFGKRPCPALLLDLQGPKTDFAVADPWRHLRPGGASM